MGHIKDTVLQSIDFIEQNLQNPLNVQDISNSACYSLYHFIRLFEGVTGHTPKNYILNRRIAEASREIRNSGKKVIDICFDYQFGSPEAFSRAFKKITGTSPAEFRKQEYNPGNSLLKRISIDSLPHRKSPGECEVHKISMDSMVLEGMVTLIREDKKIIGDIWQYMAKELNRTGTDFPEKFYGHSFWSNTYNLEGFFLMCGYETSENTDSQAPFCRRTVPASDYLQFTHRGSVEHIQHSYDFIFQTYLPQSTYSLTSPWDFEVFFNNGKHPEDEEGETLILIPC